MVARKLALFCVTWSTKLYLRHHAEGLPLPWSGPGKDIVGIVMYLDPTSAGGFSVFPAYKKIERPQRVMVLALQAKPSADPVPGRGRDARRRIPASEPHYIKPDDPLLGVRATILLELTGFRD